ncbi:hypothetical protein WR25_27276 [Diploscapter pachys]|uniref:Uncharacterized protein n=1 Tax=Diploscapter pachys TaxID=2018661 RepID=A0A2A2JH97_9BILA|nr:hypothetical protein WR25_27276 [Diploscapter pachys]
MENRQTESGEEGNTQTIGKGENERGASRVRTSERIEGEESGRGKAGGGKAATRQRSERTNLNPIARSTILEILYAESDMEVLRSEEKLSHVSNSI